MAEFLDTITEHVRGALAQRKRECPASLLRDRPLFNRQTRGFARQLADQRRHIIAEIKRASPSRGMIRQDFDPLAIARDYANNGASAISVLTEERFFKGNLTYLEQIHDAVSLPLLRKDFILDEYQLIEAKSFGADAILLIAAMLPIDLMRALRDHAVELSLDVLVEVHNEEELERALAIDAQLLGINNRDLRTFEVNIATTERLAPRLPANALVVCESGIDSPEQMRHIEQLGVHVFLVGESLMRAPEPGAKLAALLTH